jgi:hypothetical protein
VNYDNTNTGVLFKADPKKKKNENSPDYIGSINVEGREWTLFGRLKKSKANKFFVRLSVTQPKPKPETKFDAEFDDDLQFLP